MVGHFDPETLDYQAGEGMDILLESWTYMRENESFFRTALGRHLELSFLSLGISILVALPLGIWIARHKHAAQYVIHLFNAFRVVPSLAILFLTLPFLGIGFLPALVALSVLAFPPILLNTYVGIGEVDPFILEAARSTGMNRKQLFLQVEFPLALPAIVTGIRIASVEVISSATLASFIGGGGLGDFITRGFALYDIPIMLTGAIPVALLALLSEGFWTLFLYFSPIHHISKEDSHA
ncbi:MAG: hypothetical protein Kow009_10050 [Spirochaetales bacterium]